MARNGTTRPRWLELSRRAIPTPHLCQWFAGRHLGAGPCWCVLSSLVLAQAQGLVFLPTPPQQLPLPRRERRCRTHEVRDVFARCWIGTQLESRCTQVSCAAAVIPGSLETAAIGGRGAVGLLPMPRRD